MEHPYRKERIAHLTVVEVDAGMGVPHVCKSHDCPVERVHRTDLYPLVGLLLRGLLIHVELVGNESGEVCGIERHHLAVIIGFYGLHVGIVHLFRGIHGHMIEAHDSVPLQQIVIGPYVPVVICGPGGNILAEVLHGSVAVAVIDPERNIDAGEVLYVVLGSELLRKKLLSLAELSQLLLGLFLVDLERYYVVRLVNARERFHDYGVIIAIRTFRSRSGHIRIDLSSAGRTYIYPHVLSLGVCPDGVRGIVGVPSEIGSLCGLGSSLIELLGGLHRETVTAMVTF